MMNERKGFTLVELAIVLVIIGLLISGVLAGNELIAAASRNRLLRDINELRLAHNTFVLKYNCRPGDCAKAASAIDPSLVNGNGNNLIDSTSEQYQLFYHLAAAKLIRYTPVNLAGCYDEGDGATKVYDANQFEECNFFRSVKDTPINIHTNGNGGVPREVICINGDLDCFYKKTITFNAEDFRAIDQKIDDGMPWTGTMLSAECTTVALTDNFEETGGSIADRATETYDTSKTSCVSMVKF